MAGEQWCIRMFGGLAARRGERELTHFETHKTAALLALLALQPGRALPREALAEQLWPDEDPDATRSRLRQALSALRRELAPPGCPEAAVVLADRAEVRLDPRAVVTDVAQFAEEVRLAAASQDPAERARHLRRAVDMHVGELLPGYYEDRIDAERDSLEEQYHRALAELAETLASTGDLGGAVEQARRLVAADPLREDAHCLLMRLYAASGRTADALRQYRDLERALHEELAIGPSEPARALVRQLHAGPEVRPAPSGPGPAKPARGLAAPVDSLEPEGGAVPLDSPYYVARSTDAEFEAAIARRDSIVLVKGPRQTGKTSLLARGLMLARQGGARVVLTDLQKMTDAQLSSADTLFYTLAESLVDQLGLEVALEAAWQPRRGWNVNFERVVRREVLGQIDGPLVWALDEVDRLFACPYRSEVLGLFRSWHNERSLNPEGPWGRLTQVIAYATEAHLLVSDLNQSPFNVGTRLVLDDFSRGEVEELNRRYGSPLHDPAEVARYYELVGGNPYLVRRGLHALTGGALGLAALEAHAADDEGPFADHLRRMFASVSHDAALCEALRAVLRGQACPSADSFYRLRSAGLIAGSSELHARPRCGLYRRYLDRRLA